MFLGLRTVCAFGTGLSSRMLMPLHTRQGKFRGGAAFSSSFDFSPPALPSSKEPINLTFQSLSRATLEESSSVVIIGRGDMLASALAGGLSGLFDASVSDAMLKSRKAGDSGVTVSSWLPTPSGKPRHITLVHFCCCCVANAVRNRECSLPFKQVQLPSKASRHNSPARPDAIPSLLKTAASSSGSKGKFTDDVFSLHVFRSPRLSNSSTSLMLSNCRSLSLSLHTP